MDTLWNDYQAALSRKLTDQLATLAARNADGEITDRELHIACDAIYHIITGLVPWDIANMIKDVCDALPCPPRSNSQRHNS